MLEPEKTRIWKLVDDLYWELERMSASGQQTLNELSDELELHEDAIWAHQELLDQQQQEEEDDG
jgi:predicted metal-dependent HD superfamily phosphohydrolase